MSTTGRRKTVFAEAVLNRTSASIGFADVGSGGQLKAPWCYLPAALLYKFEFEPTGMADAALPLCVSDRVGTADFHVALDERASSLQLVDRGFVERFGYRSMLPQNVIKVRCTTLDDFFSANLPSLDALDINVEGHDFQVLQGSDRTLSQGLVKLIKIEFELAPVYSGQGWFSDIDQFLRAKGFDLADIEIETSRPVKVRHFYCQGEPLWGKAYYVPSAGTWEAAIRKGAVDAAQTARALALLVSAGMAGRAYDLLDMGVPLPPGLKPAALKEEIRRVFAWAKVERGAGLLARIARAIAR